MKVTQILLVLLAGLLFVPFISGQELVKTECNELCQQRQALFAVLETQDVKQCSTLKGNFVDQCRQTIITQQAKAKVSILDCASAPDIKKCEETVFIVSSIIGKGIHCTHIQTESTRKKCEELYNKEPLEEDITLTTITESPGGNSMTSSLMLGVSLFLTMILVVITAKVYQSRNRLEEKVRTLQAQLDAYTQRRVQQQPVQNQAQQRIQPQNQQGGQP